MWRDLSSLGLWEMVVTYYMAPQCVLVAFGICSCLLSTSTSALTATGQPKWGSVRPPRVLAINDTIYVHVVPHTHDDVGWLETVDEYYYGGNNT